MVSLQRKWQRSIPTWWRETKTSLVRRRIPSVEAGTKDLRIVMPRAHPISGVVTDSSGATPVRRSVVAFDEPDGNLVAQTWTDDQGAFTLAVPAGSKVTVSVVDRDGQSLASAAEVAAGSSGVALRIAR